MREAFPDAMVHGWEDLVEKMTNDRHVLAAAAAGDADMIVTDILDDFPTDECAPLGIRASSADAFLYDIWRDDRGLGRTMIEEQAADLREHDTESVLEVLTAHVPQIHGPRPLSDSRLRNDSHRLGQTACVAIRPIVPIEPVAW